MCRVLHCLEGVHPSQSGTLLILLIPRLLGHPQLAPARLAGTLACRRAELLLTLSADEVAAQLSEADLKKIMDILHSTSLARKLVSASNQKNRKFNFIQYSIRKTYFIPHCYYQHCHYCHCHPHCSEQQPPLPQSLEPILPPPPYLSIFTALYKGSKYTQIRKQEVYDFNSSLKILNVMKIMEIAQKNKV